MKSSRISESVDSIRMLREKPEYFVRNFLNHDPWSIPSQILNDLAKPNASVAVKACHSSGKCVPANEKIMLADGSRIRAKDLIGKDFKVLSVLSEGYHVTEGKADWNLVEQTLSIITDTGRKIIRNLSHPLYCSQKHRSKSSAELLGWMPMTNIMIGDYVAVPWDIHGLEGCSINDHLDEEFKLAGYFFGSAGLDGTGPLNKDEQQTAYDEITACFSALGADVIPEPNGLIRGFPYEITLNSEFSTRFRELGFSEDSIPNWILSAPAREQVLFLSRLFTLGGYIDHTDRYRISFMTPREGVARDLQHLLTRHGIISTVSYQEKNIWRVFIDTVSDCIKFLIDIKIYGQEEKIYDAHLWYDEWSQTNQISQVRTNKPNFPALPNGMMWDRVSEVYMSGIQQTVAIEVPDTHTFVNDFWEHNTHTAADATLWFTSTGGKTITTAPTWTQVEKLIWAEIHRTYDWAGHLLGGELLQTQYRITTNAMAFGISTDRGVNLQGHHDKGGGVLIIIDEAPGVKPDIWDSIQGIRAGGDVRVLALGNPVISGGEFFEAFNKNKRQWKTYTISAFDTPNFEGIDLKILLNMSQKELDENIRPYLVTRRWVYERYHQWGPAHPNWRARVLGQFPDQTSVDLLADSWIKEAVKRPMFEETHLNFSGGLDVAGAGSDSTVLTVMHGRNQVEQLSWEDEDPRREVRDAMAFWRQKGNLITKVDSIGIGHYFIQYLIDEGFTIIPVNVSQPPVDTLVWTYDLDPNMFPSKRFGNLKAQLYWSLREKLQGGEIRLLDIETQTKQARTIRYKEDERNGKIYIEPKDNLKKRGFDSPDSIESLMLACADMDGMAPISVLTMAVTSGWGFGNGI